MALRRDIKRQQPEDRVGRAFQAIFVNRTRFSEIWSAGPLGGRDQRGNTKITDRWRPKKIVKALREARELLEGRLQVASMDAVAYVTCMIEEDPSGLYHLDPPYIQEGWQLYREQMTRGDHERLAAVLWRVPRWVLSLDLCREVEALYSYASSIPVETCYTAAKTRGRRNGRGVPRWSWCRGSGGAAVALRGRRDSRILGACHIPVSCSTSSFSR